MSLSILPVRTRSDVRAFHALPRSIYADIPHWVSPIIFDRKKTLDLRKNPLWQRASRELWIARQDRRPVGRICAIDFPAHSETHGEDLGFFGFFEAIDDVQVAAQLFGAAEEWLKERGCQRIRGPLNPTINDESGLLVDGFEDAPQILMPYNPQYYESLIESVGLGAVKDLYAWRLTPEFLTAKLERVRTAVASRYNVSTKGFRFGPKSAFQEDVALLRSLYNRGWEDNWGAIQMTNAEFDFVATDLKTIAEKQLVRIVYVGEEPAGFVLALPDINRALAPNRSGRLVGAGWNLLTNRRAIDRGRIVLLGLLPEFRGKGIDAVLYHDIGTRMIDGLGYVESEASWILEENRAMNRAIHMMGGERYKTYRLFEKRMTEN